MEGAIDYPNPKLRFVAWLFGPLIKFLEDRQISSFFGSLFLSSIVIYFFYFRGFTKGRKVDWKGMTLLVVWLGLLVLAILDQIDIIRNPHR